MHTCACNARHSAFPLGSSMGPSGGDRGWVGGGGGGGGGGT